MILEFLCSLQKDRTMPSSSTFQYLREALPFYCLTFEDYGGSDSKKENVTEMHT